MGFIFDQRKKYLLLSSATAMYIVERSQNTCTSSHISLCIDTQIHVRQWNRTSLKYKNNINKVYVVVLY